MNTFSDSNGHFWLTSNDRCNHFEISAVGYDRIRINRAIGYPWPADRPLPNQLLEYQQIDYGPFFPDLDRSFALDSSLFDASPYCGSLGTVRLRRL